MAAFFVNLWHDDIDAICVAWRKGVRQVLGLPGNANCEITPILNGCLAMMDELCRRSIKFTSGCVVSEYAMVLIIILIIIIIIHNFLACRLCVGRR